jgi:DNA-directed RNA polymerase subunit M/transcription elongation factor TFIIS
VNDAAGGVLECRRGSIFVRGKFFARQNLSMRVSLRLQRPVPARSKPGQAMVEFLKRSVQRLKPPTCDLCHEPMVWFNSVRTQGTTDMISHFFMCSHCHNVKEVTAKQETRGNNDKPPPSGARSRRTIGVAQDQRVH